MEDVECDVNQVGRRLRRKGSHCEDPRSSMDASITNEERHCAQMSRWHEKPCFTRHDKKRLDV